ncbi:MAG: N-6 DNA methylase [Armatimonadota bacterium]|nr:N-6 DNA methylase [Armatimonadota bacterium]
MNGFAVELGRYLEHLGRLRKMGASEDSLRDAFLSFLRSVFPDIQTAESILLEKHVPALRVRGGFADVLYSDLILEFKRRLDDSSRREGAEELSRYLLNQPHPERYFGILTDGETLEVYAIRDDRLTTSPIDTLRLSIENADRCKLWLDCYLFHEKRLPPTANDVALRFGEHSPVFWQSIRILASLWQTTGKQPAVQTKFGEWQSLLSIVYGSEVGDETLFMRHTYLALFARTLAFVALRQCAPSDAELEEILTGAVFHQMGLDNFVEDDFFTWMEAGDIADLIHSIATRLVAAYDLSVVSEDLLKELYQELVDPQTRHDLGEFYTPEWLAELTLRHAGFPSAPEGIEPSLLDPACGSGTFLFAAVHLLREAGWKGDSLVQFCEANLAGLDVHPLAVVISKTNMVLALGEELRTYAQQFSLPIFIANAFAVAEDGGLQKPHVLVPVAIDLLAKTARKCRERSLPSAFLLPAELAEQPRTLNTLIDAMMTFGNPEIEEEAARNGFQGRLDALAIPRNRQYLWLQNLRLMRWLLQPPATDTVWQFILKNAYRPELLARRKFAFVVGNPPWLSYRFIQRADYQKQVRALTLRRYQLVDPSDANLFTQMEMATLFFAFAAEHYLANRGKIAFVMPRSVITGAKQHVLFRQRFIESAALLIDCEQVTPLFNMPTCVLIWQKTPEPTAARQTPSLLVRGELPKKNASLEEAKQHLHFERQTYRALVSAAKSPYLERIINGATIYPRCLWFVRTYPEALIVDREFPYLETDVSIEPRTKAPWKDLRVRGRVEIQFVYATLLSHDLLPFGWRRMSPVVIPILGNQMSNWQRAYREGYGGLGEWLKKAEQLWLQYRKSQTGLIDYLNWHNKVLRQKTEGVFKLVYNTSGTHLCAAVVPADVIREQQIGRIYPQGFIADYTTYWFDTEQADEVYFLSAVLNARSVNEAIKPFQPKGAFGAQSGRGERHITRRPFEVLPIPLFDPQDKSHLRLAQLSQECHKRVQEFLAQAEEKVLRMSSGRLRQTVRELLKEQLDEIDDIVKSMLGGAQVCTGGCP